MKRRGSKRARGSPAIPAPDAAMSVAMLSLGRDAYAVFAFPVGAQTGGANVQPTAAPALTAAERDIAAGLLAGESNAHIARRRGTSVRTVANQVASLFRKANVQSRAELVARWCAAAAGPANRSTK